MKLLWLLLLLPFRGEPVPYKPTFCTLLSKDPALYCRCRLEHPKMEFCKSSKLSLPDCCIVLSKGSKAKSCGCCWEGSGRNKGITDIVEYMQ